MSTAAMRDAATDARSLPPTARRGRFNERVLADVRYAARVAREEGVRLRVRHD